MKALQYCREATTYDEQMDLSKIASHHAKTKVGTKDQSEVEAVMDPELWENLPDDVLEKVIVRIPFPSLVSFRIVCKKWNSLITNPPPHIAYPVSLGASRLPALLYWGPLEVKNRSVTEWIQTCYKKSDSTTESTLLWKSECKSRPVSFPVPMPEEELHLIASEGGLLVFGCRDRRSDIITDLLVCNPLLGKTKRLSLPSTPILSMLRSCTTRTYFLGVIVSPETKSYKLLVAGEEFPNNPYIRPGTGEMVFNSPFIRRGSRTSLLYDSISCTWKHCALLPPDPGFLTNRHTRMIGRSIACDGSLYWQVIYGPMFLNCSENITALFRYDMEKDAWSRYDTDFLRRTAKANLQMGLYRGQISFSRMGDSDFDCRVWKRDFDLPRLGSETSFLSYQMLDKVQQLCDRGDREAANESLMHFMYFCFSQGDLFLQVVPEVSQIMSEDSILRVTMHSGSENSYTSLEWQTLGSGYCMKGPVSLGWETLSSRFYRHGPTPFEWGTLGSRFSEKDPVNIYAFWPSLSLLP